LKYDIDFEQDKFQIPADKSDLPIRAGSELITLLKSLSDEKIFDF